MLAFVKIWRNVQFQKLANAKLKTLVRYFDPYRVSPTIRVLGAVSCSVRRAYSRAEEVRRFEATRKCARQLGCCGLSLPLQLRYLRQFSLSKVNFGWVARAPSWTSCEQLWSCFWASVRRCRYRSPWLRCLFLGMLCGLLASCLRSFGTILYQGFWSCLVASFWYCRQ